MTPSSLLAAAERLEHEIALLLNRLVLASAAWGRQEHLDLPVEDRFTDADIDKLEGEIKSNVSRLRALLGESQTALMTFGMHAVVCTKGRVCVICGRYQEHEVHGHDFHKGYGHEFEPNDMCSCGFDAARALVAVAMRIPVNLT
jgi:hypothetical protein